LVPGNGKKFRVKTENVADMGTGALASDVIERLLKDYA
jgi:hypothetical protein